MVRRAPENRTDRPSPLAASVFSARLWPLFVLGSSVVLFVVRLHVNLRGGHCVTSCFSRFSVESC